MTKLNSTPSRDGDINRRDSLRGRMQFFAGNRMKLDLRPKPLPRRSDDALIQEIVAQYPPDELLDIVCPIVCPSSREAA